MRILGASGQLGYGIPTPAFSAGLDRQPHLIGCDMGSIDIGPYYLGSGEMATAPASTRRDLKKVLHGALKHKIPLVIGSAGSAGARPHLDQTLALVREIASDDGLGFRLAVLRADVDRNVLKAALKTNGVTPIDDMPALDDQDIDAAANIVGQMGMSAFQRALAAGVDVVIAGRACDTGIFAALPAMTGFPVGLAMHMAKIIECASLCCLPGGRDAILATLDHEGFELDSMAPQRRATPVSVAAHSLYEQSDPFTVHEPEGRLDLARATYRAIDDRRTRVFGARWEDAREHWVKIEGARKVGERAVDGDRVAADVHGREQPRVNITEALLAQQRDGAQDLVVTAAPVGVPAVQVVGGAVAVERDADEHPLGEEQLAQLLVELDAVCVNAQVKTANRLDRPAEVPGDRGKQNGASEQRLPAVQDDAYLR